MISRTGAHKVDFVRLPASGVVSNGAGAFKFLADESAGAAVGADDQVAAL
jgi:hypothetical protein